ncbi:MAG: exo-alpha-sialidase [Candidatus Eremiobacteraeota bacterium]|nr:exo-alpha-sialidase [Candidatus Eremiobacteraeota bacterium]
MPDYAGAKAKMTNVLFHRWIRAGLFVVALASCGGRNATVPPLSGAQVAPSSRNREAATANGGFETERLWGAPARDDWEPTNAADPSSSWVYQITTRQRPNFLLFRSSANGGTTWNPSRHICRRDFKLHFQFDPQIVVARNGTVDVACLDNFLPGVVFTQSRDHGHTWSAPVRLDGFHSYSDKPTLLVAPSGNDVYVSFNIDYALYVAASHDGGITWNRPVRATTRRLWYYSYGGTVAPDGSVWFAVDGEAGKNQTGDGHIALVLSVNRGISWTTIPMAVTREGAPCRYKNCYPDFYTGQDAIAADSDGGLVFVYAQNQQPQGPNALYVRSSRDGVRWTPPLAIATVGNSTSPAICAGPAAGDFRLVWQDNRNGAHAWNTWYARSTDRGASWSSAVRLSDLGTGPPYKHRNGYDFPFGDYLGLSVDARGLNHVIWGEGSGVYVPGGTWFTRGI